MDGDKSKKKTTRPLATTVAAVITMAVLFSGGLVVTSSYAQTTEEETTGEAAAPTTTTTVETPPSSDNETATATEEGTTVTTTVEPEGGEAATTTEETTEEPPGNAILPEQVFSSLEECFVMLESFGMLIVQASSPPEIQDSLETESGEIVEGIDIPPEIVIEIDEVVGGVTQNDSAVGGALEERLNASDVVENIVADEILGEALDNAETSEGENLGEAIDGIIQDGAESVLNGSQTADQAVENVQGNLSDIVSEIELTPEDIENAAETIQSENQTGDMLEPVGPPAEEQAAEETGEQPSEDEILAGNVTVGAEEEEQEEQPPAAIDVALEEELEESIPEIAAETGQDSETIRQLLTRALALLG